MIETFLMLLVAHLLGDFVLRTDRMRERRGRPGYLALHSGIVVLAAGLLLGAAPLALLLPLFAAHLVVDALSARLPERLSSFLVEQLAHVAVALGLALTFPAAFDGGAWAAALDGEDRRLYLRLVTGLAGLLVCVPAGGALIAAATRPLIDEIDGENQIDGLRKGGRYIGWLERALVMLLLAMELPSGIGFLFAAKSILRFGEVRDSSQRKVAEYIIIGTFMSFGWALLVSWLTLLAIAAWRGAR